MSETDDLRKWILDEMTIDVKDKLSVHKERVKRYIEFTEGGEIMLKESNNIPTWGRVALYMIGKLYAQYAGLTPERHVSNKELTTTLNMPEGTVKSATFKLHNEGWIFSQEGLHQIRYGSVGTILDAISQTEERR
jgi:hypothetical protein